MGKLTDLSAGFVVRIWREPGEVDGDRVEWRGSVECVRCGKKRYFSDANRMVEFIKQHLAIIGLSDVFREP